VGQNYPNILQKDRRKTTSDDTLSTKTSQKRKHMALFNITFYFAQFYSKSHATLWRRKLQMCEWIWIRAVHSSDQKKFYKQTKIILRITKFILLQ